MASVTGIPETNPISEERVEYEPLLGQVGDASQREGQGIQLNLVIGTAFLAQAGIWILTTIIWAAILTSNLQLFSAHPLLNSTAILLLTQSILLLQPTHSPHQKVLGTTIHFALNVVSLALLIASLVVIEYNKISHGGVHFDSLHARLGLITYILIVAQALIGVTQYYIPSIYGGINNAKKMYKYHRSCGYLLLLMMFATVAAATQTQFNISTLRMQLWAVLVAEVVVLIGMLPRVKKQKLGFA